MSIHETWQTSIDELLCQPDALETYANLRCRMIAREFEPITDVITQRWRGSFDLYDAYVFGQIYAGLRAGCITITPIYLGLEPSSDAQLNKNQTKLAGLPSPFTATIQNGGGDNDGEFAWTETIVVGTVELEPRHVPLEIGYTRPLTTLWHLHLERGLARWPYGHDRIWLLMQHTTGLNRNGIPALKTKLPDAQQVSRRNEPDDCAAVEGPVPDKDCL